MFPSQAVIQGYDGVSQVSGSAQPILGSVSFPAGYTRANMMKNSKSSCFNADKS
jgi:hypothetical protein